MLTDVAQLETVAAQWNSLLAFSARPRPSLTVEWLLTARRHFGSRNGLCVLIFRDHERLVGIAPLVQKPICVAGVPVMRGMEFAVGVADCRDLLIEAGKEWAVVEAFFQWAKTEGPPWELIRLRGLCSQSPTHHLLPLLANYAGLSTTMCCTAPCANLQLPASMQEFLENMPSQRRRRAFAQARRKLVSDYGEPSLRAVVGTEVTSVDVQTLCRLHRSAWATRGGSAILDERFEGFLLDLALSLAPSGQPLLTFLRLNGEDVAGHYGFLLNGRFFVYIVGFDPRYAAYSMGAQALLALVEYGISHGWKEIDLMRGGERYKFDFTRLCCRGADVWIARSPRRLRVATALAALRGRFCM